MENKETVLKIETNDIIWPGQLPAPPIGRPEKRFFRIVTLEEPPFMMFVEPDENGRCGHYAVPCQISDRHFERYFLNSLNNLEANEMTPYQNLCLGQLIEINNVKNMVYVNLNV